MRQVTNLTFEQYEKLWKMFVDALSGLLRACEGRYEEGTPTAHRLTQLSVEAGFLHVAMALAHPSRITSYHYSMGRVRCRVTREALCCVPSRMWLLPEKCIANGLPTIASCYYCT